MMFDLNINGESFFDSMEQGYEYGELRGRAFIKDEFYYHMPLPGVTVEKERGKSSLLNIPDKLGNSIGIKQLQIPTSIIKWKGDTLYVHRQIFISILEHQHDTTR